MKNRLVLLLPCSLFLGSLVPLSAAEERPYLGVRVAVVPEALAGHLDLEGGVMVEDVVPGSPAGKAGLKRHDVVVAVGGDRVTGPEALRKVVHRHRAGDTISLEVRRGAKTLRLDVELGSTVAPAKPREAKGPGFLGVRFSPVPEALAAHLGLEEGAGVIIDDVLDDSAAAKAGIKRIDVLTAVDGQAINSTADAYRLISERREGDEVSLDVIHKGKKAEVMVTLGSTPEDAGPPSWELWRGGRGTVPRAWVPGRIFPSPWFRGKVTIVDPDGNERVIEIPEVQGELPGLRRKLQEEYEKQFKDVPGDLHQRIKKLLEELKDKDLDVEKYLPLRRRDPLQLYTERKLLAVTRSVEDGYDITVRHEDGKRTVTVKKDGETLAENLPWKELDSLPEDVREKVGKLEELMPDIPHDEGPREKEKKSDEREGGGTGKKEIRV